MDCLRTLAGLSDFDCKCYDFDRPTDYNESRSGLYITDIMPLSFTGAMQDCENGGLWDILSKARDRAIKDVLRDYTASLYIYHSQRFTPYPVADTTNEKRIGEYANNSSFEFTNISNVAGIWFSPKKIKGGRAVLRAFELKLDGLSNAKMQYFIADNYRGAITDGSFNYTSTNDFVRIELDQPVVLEFDNVAEDLRYFIGYSIPSGAKYANNEIVGGCCGRTGPTYNPFLSYMEYQTQIYGFEATGTEIEELDEPISSSGYAKGLRLDMSLTCDPLAWLCGLSANPTDISQNGANGEGIRFGMTLADLIIAAASIYVGRKILQSQNLNRITMLAAESVVEIMEQQKQIYEEGINFFARETPLWANDCLDCQRNRNISKNTILR